MIREPVDWLGSWYRYRSREELNGTPNSTANVSFDEFVAAYLSDNPPEFARVGSQAKFMSDKDGALGLSHLFRYDDMDGLVRFLQNRLNRQFTLGRANQSPKGETSLSPTLLAEYQKACAQDFEIYERLSPES
ncbi:MAG: hypothetical protein GYB24_10410 [Rhodobacteraceae bacterium]|nr:hypothetical protein [Paracoccaceae bacterium]